MSIKSTDDTLSYDVFITEPFPLNVSGPLPNGEPRMFSPLSTTLIAGRHEAVLVDPPLTIDQARAVGDWVEAHGKKLAHIFVTHGHGDHWFTAGLLAERFGAQVVATAGTIEHMRVNASIRELFWDKLWPGQIPPVSVTAVKVPNNRFALEGHELVIIEVGHTDTDEASVLHVPDLGLVVAGDALYNGVHQYLGESANGGRDDWRKAIDTVAALRPRWIVAGHKNKDLDDEAVRIITETREYLYAADDLLTKHRTARDFFNAMLERYSNRQLGATVLWAGSRSLYAWRDRQAEDSLAGWL